VLVLLTQADTSRNYEAIGEGSSVKATGARLLEFLREVTQFIIPICQRTCVVIQLSVRELPNGWLPGRQVCWLCCVDRRQTCARMR